MLKQYIKQTFQMLKENRLVSTISITGTAISVTMIMMVVLVLQVQVANYYPEEHRDRMLYVENGTLVRMKENTGNWNSGNMSIEAVKECFYTLQSPEFVTAYAISEFTVSLPDKRNYMAHSVKLTDTGFWKVFSFHFVAGAPFTEADVASGVPQAVITEPLARRLFGTIDNIIGKEIRLDVKPYRVCGVVEEVSKAAASAFADIWIPYTTNESCQSSFNENMVGSFRVLLLAKAQGDFDVIRQELKQQITRYNATKEKYEISFFENPITQWDKAMGTDGQNFVDWKDFWLETGGAMLFLLLVPVLNLSGNIVRQVLYENGLMSLLGGMIGLLLSWSLFPLCKDFLLKASDTTLRAEMLFRPEAFVLALLFCLLINLLSAGLPAWWISRKPIYEALKNGEETNK